MRVTFFHYIYIYRIRYIFLDAFDSHEDQIRFLQRSGIVGAVFYEAALNTDFSGSLLELAKRVFSVK